MSDNKGTTLGIIALIIALTGVGLFAYDFFFAPKPGATGNPNTSSEIYNCTSSIEVQNALASIGSGKGTILITEDISISETIEINGGGEYIIQGVDSITIEITWVGTAINITNVSSCILKDFIIDGSAINDYGTPMISINEIHNNPVLVRNVDFEGDSINEAYGLDFYSNNVIIEGCVFNYLRTGAYSYSADNCRFIQNTVTNSYDALYFVGTDSSTIDSNVVNTTTRGIMLGANSFGTTVVNNIVRYVGYSGIRLFYADWTVITGNSIIYSIGGGSNLAGIALDGGDNCTVSDNFIGMIDSGSSGAGISLSNYADYNTVYGNYLLNNFDGIVPGTGSGNVFYDNQITP
ncbi:MAG: right-handed parallel beta-helix repeat-containing protein [Candidatus Lokiarchaeota archaeon]|nr:right-handed parallel beta-helix repeat-containing protein [Candidatus Lokiarchaeota archaeon]